MNENTSRKLPQNWVLALGAAGIFLAGLLIGTLASGGNLFAFAATRSPATTTTQHVTVQSAGTPALSPQDAQRYCQLYEDTIVKETGVSADQLEKANADALQAVLDQMVADGKITKAQETQIEQQLAQLRSQPCQHLSQLGKGAAPSASQQQLLTSARGAIVAAVATSLNLAPDKLQSDLTAGQSVPAIAQAQGVGLDKVNTAYLGAVQAQLSAAVKSGLITQGQSDQLYSAIQTAVAAGHYPLLEGRMGSLGG